MRLLTAASLLFMLLAPDVFAAPPKFRKAAHAVLEEYIVVLKDMPRSQVDDVANQLARAHDGRIMMVLKNGFKGFGVRMTEEQAMRLAEHPLVDFVEENGIAHISTTQTLPSNGVLWNLDILDARPWMSLDNTYSYISRGNNVRAYVIDTGVLAHHYEFDLDGNPSTVGSRVASGANMVVSWGDYWPADNPCGGQYTDPDDAYGPGHGTAVASVLGGRDVGVAKGVTIVPVKVATCRPFAVYTLAICWGLDWVIEDMQLHSLKRGLVSMSVYAEATDAYVGAMEYSVNNVIAAGIPVIASANNQANGNCTTSPARMGNTQLYPYWNVVTAGGAEADGTIWECEGAECTGLDPGSNFGPCVTVYAPAHNLRLAHPITDSLQPAFGGPYPTADGYRSNPTQRAGTSFAAPYVAGVAARILQAVPTMAAEDLRAAIIQRAQQRTGKMDLDPSGVFNDNLVYASSAE